MDSKTPKKSAWARYLETLKNPPNPFAAEESVGPSWVDSWIQDSCPATDDLSLSELLAIAKARRGEERVVPAPNQAECRGGAGLRLVLARAG